MVTSVASRFIKLPNRPIVQSNGQTVQDSLELHYWEWKGRQPTILFCHAASFHGRCYDRIIEEALQGFHVIALDFRGHGRSQQHPPPYRFRWFGEDVLQFIETLELPTDNLVGNVDWFLTRILKSTSPAEYSITSKVLVISSKTLLGLRFRSVDWCQTR